MIIPLRYTLTRVVVAILICGVVGVPILYAVKALFDTESVRLLVVTILLLLAGLVLARIIYRDQLQNSLGVIFLTRRDRYIVISALAVPCAIAAGTALSAFAYLWQLIN